MAGVGPRCRDVEPRCIGECKQTAVTVKTNSLELLFNRQVINRAMSIRSDAAHCSLNAEYDLLSSGRRLRGPVPQKTGTNFPLFLSLFAV